MRPPLRPADVLERDPRLQLADLPDGRLLVRRGGSGGGVVLIEGVTRQEAEAVLAEIDGKRTAEAVANAVAGLASEQAVRILRRLFGEAIHRRVPPVEGRILVLGNGRAGHRLTDLLGSRGLRNVALETPADAGGRFRGADLVIVILERTPYQEIFDVQAACLDARVTSLYATFDADGTRVGPSVVPGRTACFACSQLVHLSFLGQDAWSAAKELRTIEWKPASRVLRILCAEARELLADDGEPAFLSRVLHLSPTRRASYTAAPSDSCPLGCAKASPSSERFADRASAQLAEAEERRPPVALPRSGEELVRSVGILGGGTAGYLTALALRHRLPRLEVTLVESSAVPIIGVGEATTPLMPQFLHADLGLDVHELFREVRPTLKLGIRFLWGTPEDGDFNYPFGPLRTLESVVYDGHPRNCSLRSMMMTSGRVPVLAPAAEDEPPISRLDTEVAYHLDNARFVRYLREKAREAGVGHVDATIADVEVSGDGNKIRALVADDGRRLAFDFFVDCSGFRSLLVGEALRSPFVSFAGSLFADRAWVATAPNDGVVLPYTQAETYDSGWCWSTPQAEEDHRGYVFSSAFASPEEALAEMRARNPEMGEPRLVEFRAGRRAHFWRGNAVALGNAYGFVEPLESTALHMLIRQIGLLVEAFPLRRGDRGPEGLLNRKVGGAWDYLRWFLALHYKFNRKLGTPFWKACRESVDVSSHGELLEAFRERGPLSYDRMARLHFDYPDPLWGPEGIDAVLLGQEVASRLPCPGIGRQEWRKWTQRCRSVVRSSLPQARALELLAEDPRLLECMGAAYRAAGPAFLVRSSLW